MKRITPLLLGLAAVLAGCVAPDPALDAALKANVHAQVVRCNTAVDAKKPSIMIGVLETDLPNSVGGVDVIIGYVVTGPKTLKYAHFDVTVLNRVGDPATCNVRRSASQTLVCTGPVQTGIWQAFNRFQCVVYNNTATFARIDKAHLSYMDGSEEIIEGAALAELFTDPAVNVFETGVQQTYQTRVVNNGYFTVQKRITYPY